MDFKTSTPFSRVLRPVHMLVILVVATCSACDRPPEPPKVNQARLQQVDALAGFDRHFRDLLNSAESTASSKLAPIVQEMQKVRRDVEGFQADGCASIIRLSLENGMNKIIAGYQILNVSQPLTERSVLHPKYGELSKSSYTTPINEGNAFIATARKNMEECRQFAREGAPV